MTLRRTPMKRTPFVRPETRGDRPARYAKVDLPANWPVQYISEKKFQADVEDAAARLGWLSSHSHLPFFDTAGWPDLALLHEEKHRFMVRELKVTSAKGKVGSPTPTQWRWLTGLARAGVDAGVWTWPFDADRLIEELSQ